MNDQKLDDLVIQYALDKKQLDVYKKVCEDESSSIKRTMADKQLSEYSVNNYTVKRIIQHREDLDEEKLVSILQHNHILNVIKMKPYVDFDALESEIYLGNIPDHVLVDISKIKQVKEVETLKLTIKKEK